MLEFLIPIQELQSRPEAAADQAAYDPTVRGRLLDATSGAPVAGATCELWTEEFDQPGQLVESALSRADGSYELHPTSRDEIKVRLRAAGFRGSVISADGGLELLYPNDEPLIVRVLDLDGKPIAGARIRSHQTCRHAPPAVEAVSGADGRVVLDGAPIETSTDYEVRASGYGALVPLYFEDQGSELSVYLPRRAPVRLRLLDADGRPLANRRFRQQGPGLTALVTDREGRAVLDSLFDSREVVLTDCAKVLPGLVGYPALEGECVIQVGVESPEPDRSEWPRLRVSGIELHSDLHVQFGDDSVSREFDNARYLTFETPVLPGREVVVLSQGPTLRRARLEPWSGPRELDLADPALVIRPRPALGEPMTIAFRARTPAGEPLAVEGELGGGYVDHPPLDEDPSPDGVAFSVPRGARYEIRLSAEGFVPLARIGRARTAMNGPEVVVLARSE